MGNSLLDLGELSKPATVLIEKVSDAIGAIFKPIQIKRVAAAEGEAKKINALADIEVTAIQHRAIQRLLHEETKNQEVIEAVTVQAIPQLRADAKPQDIDDDWMRYFFERCRLTTDKEMQHAWSRILAGEANAPGSFSKRTINVVSTLTKGDAELFQNLCSFNWQVPDSDPRGIVTLPLIFDFSDPLYTSKGINSMNLEHLDDLGLINFQPLAGYHNTDLDDEIMVKYFSRTFSVKFPRFFSNDLKTGHVNPSAIGRELFKICSSSSVGGLEDYVVKKWKEHHLLVEEIVAK